MSRQTFCQEVWSEFSRQAAKLGPIRARANFYKVQAENQVKLRKILDEVQLTVKAVKTDALMRLADTKRRAGQTN